MAKEPRARQQDWNQLDDHVLVKAHLNGDGEAFEVLFKKHFLNVSRLVLSIVKSESLVDDIVQEVFLLVYRYLPKFRADSSFRTWIYRITVNESIRQLNRSRRWVTMEPQEMEEGPAPPAMVVMQEGPSPERILLEGEQRAIVHRALATLKPHHRVILTLYYLEELTVQEISQVLEIPEGSVKSRLYYARDNLKRVLEPLARDGAQRADKHKARHEM